MYANESSYTIHIAVLIFTVLGSLLLLLPPQSSMAVAVCKKEDGTIVTLHVNLEDDSTFYPVRGDFSTLDWAGDYLRGAALLVLVVTSITTIQFFVSYQRKIKVHRSVGILVLTLQALALAFICVALSDTQWEMCDPGAGLIIKILEVGLWSFLLCDGWSGRTETEENNGIIF